MAMLIRSAIVGTLLLSASLAGAQSFSEKDRQTAGTWYTQHQAKPPAGFRQQDRLSPDAESRLQIGKRLDPKVHRVYPAPPDLRRQLPTPEKGNRYVAVGGHVAVVDRRNTVHDVIHVLDKATR
jgi:Ni/Co efflux regulator RcnB